MLWFIRYLSGFVKVIFYGECPERILNLAVLHRIFLWNSKLTKDGIEVCISAKDFKKLRHIVRKSGLKFKIRQKNGLPFKTVKYRKRSGIIVGFIMFCLFLAVMSKYIWIIDVTGNNKVPDAEIIGALKEIGITKGVKSSKINAKTEREKLLLQLDSLAWASLNIEGCKLTVNVSEIKDEKPKNNSPSNLVAKADGIIEKIDVTSGNCIVNCGDTVKAGDVLVSGIIEGQNGTKFVRSQGVITAACERSITAKGDFKQKKTLENGKRKTKWVLECFWFKIPLYLGSENKNHNSYYKTKDFSLFGQTLPVKLHKKEFRFTDEYTLTYDKKRLEEKLKKEIRENLKNQEIKDYTVTEQKIIESENGITLTQIITSRENIVVSEDLMISEGV